MDAGVWVFTRQRPAGGLLVSFLFVLVMTTGCGGGTVDPCDGIDCDGHGVCAIRDGLATCLCDTGYATSGTTCVTDVCSPDPCVFGVCVATGTLPTCRCDQGYAGSLCDRCDDGYMPRGGRCVTGDPCEGDPCVFGLCAMIEGVVTCTCHQGYAGDLCDRCADGYFAEGLRCVTRSVCDPNPCIHGDCVPKGGLADCACTDGYAGDTCEDCAEGWVRDGLRCVVASGDPCDPNPCGTQDEHRNECVADGTAAMCLCDDGYVFQDGWCVESQGDPCDPNPCPTDANRSICVAGGVGGHTCLCDDGYRLDQSDTCVEDTGSLETRSCDVVVSTQVSTSGPVALRGEFNGWSETADVMTKVGAKWERTMSGLRAGDYAYKLFWREGGKERWELDPDNPYTKWVGGTRNSMLRVPDCDKPQLVLEQGPAVNGGRVTMKVRAMYGRQRIELDAAQATVTRNGTSISGTWDGDTGTFTIDDSGLEPGKYGYVFQVADTAGRRAEPLFVPLWVEDQAFDWRDATIYFVLTDRFHNGNTGNDLPVSDPKLDFKANWQGGDFAGLKQKIDAGYFDDLGVNCLWVSSPVMNTQGAFWGSDGHKYTGYHSYWPIATGWTGDTPLTGLAGPIDPHFGDMEAFKAMVAAAHARGIRVIVDFVANHVHTDSPLYTQHRNDSTPWFNWNNGTVGQGYVCGWDKPIECWFAEYLPDFDYRNGQVMDRVMDHAIWLIMETNIDGFRLDAVKHMILDFSATLRGRIDDQIDTYDGIRFYMVGETFTGEGDGEKQTIKEYVSPDLLDGQFDFPMFWAVLAALVRHERGLDSLKSFMDGNDGYYGAAAVMSTFLGNHDVPRALSHAAGQIGDLWGNGSKEQGWTAPPGQPSAEDPYRRLRMAWTFLFSQKGLPLLYYGDEFGMPGAGDPDNRRFMRFDSALSTNEKATLSHVQALGKARLRHPALRRGSRANIQVDANYWAFVMKDGTDAVLVVLNRGDAGARTLAVGAAGLPGGTYRDVLSGREISVSGGSASVSMGRLESAVFEVK
ncbi:MAG TPA: alpha-amylase family glycosyl hydrolase [Myxococcota bacterium]|nr:alpha-amylase family glycosyl hydrolase [Myxococcota bacterium]HOH76092.1 alpha-amylase family glycosyl hydrolase [Myxococcota bacterium]HPV04319.1 alpha-amylase family glycosyl hydrolase [Myxococcota bacterium]